MSSDMDQIDDKYLNHLLVYWFNFHNQLQASSS